MVSDTHKGSWESYDRSYLYLREVLNLQNKELFLSFFKESNDFNFRTNGEKTWRTQNYASSQRDKVAEVESEPFESEYVESEYVESEDVEIEYVESEDVESEYVESEPVESECVDCEYVESEDVEIE